MNVNLEHWYHLGNFPLFRAPFSSSRGEKLSQDELELQLWSVIKVTKVLMLSYLWVI